MTLRGRNGETTVKLERRDGELLQVGTRWERTREEKKLFAAGTCSVKPQLYRKDQHQGRSNPRYRVLADPEPRRRRQGDLQ